jgi:hypothetical protein
VLGSLNTGFLQQGSGGSSTDNSGHTQPGGGQMGSITSLLADISKLIAELTNIGGLSSLLGTTQSQGTGNASDPNQHSGSVASLEHDSKPDHNGLVPPHH